jgi:integrase
VSEEANAHLRDFFMLALLCGARRANLQAMRWADIDLERTRPVQEGSKTVLQPDPVWRIPAEAAKAGEAITVPLVEAAEVILRRRKASANGSPWVFPSRGRTGHLVEVKSGWQRIVKAAGVSDLRLHDLRRTFAAWQLLGGGNVVSISKSLGHSSTQSTWVYARTHYNDVRQSVESGTSMMLSAGTAKRSRKGKRHAK